MATKTTTKLISDLDGKTLAAETVKFSLDGQDFEIDLTKREAGGLRKVFVPYIEKGRKVTASRTTTTKRKYTRRGQGGGQSKQPSLAAEVRAWAAEQKPPILVKDRGQVPAKVLEAYKNAQDGQGPGK